MRGAGEARGLHGDDDVRRAVRALVPDPLDELVGIALDQADADAGFLGEGLVERPVAVVMARGIEVDLLRTRGGSEAEQGKAGGEQAEVATGGHSVTPGGSEL